MIAWIKSWLSTWQAWIELAIAIPATIILTVRLLGKCVRQLNTAYLGGVFLMNIKEEINAATAKIEAKIDERCDKIDERCGRLEAGMINTISVRRAVMEVDEVKAWFEATPSGRFEWANRLWRHLTEMDVSEIMGDGWINGVAEAERDKVMADWKQCIDAGISFDHTATLVGRRGQTTRVRISALAGRGTPGGPVTVYTGHATIL